MMDGTFKPVAGAVSDGLANAGPDRGPPRYFAGISVSSFCREVAGVVVACRGRGFSLECDITTSTSAIVPESTVQLFDDVVRKDRGPPSRVSELKVRLAEVELEVAQQLVSQNPVDPLAVGIVDPGLWHENSDGLRTHQSLCEAVGVAEATGLNIIDAFPSRDLAHHGYGGPLDVFPHWLLLGDRRPPPTGVPRIIIQLVGTTRLTYLTPGDSVQALDSTRSVQIGPGTELLDRIVRLLTNDQLTCDMGGRIAVQGRRISELFEQWQALEATENRSPWNPRGVRVEPYLELAYREAIRQHWPLQDVLCTATHYIVDTIIQAMNHTVPSPTPQSEIIVTGGGCQNGFMLRELGAQFPDVSFRQVSELGFSATKWKGTTAALLAALYVDQVPANLPAVTGADAPRIAGRLTPGSPTHWDRLLVEMSEHRPKLMTLRQAV